MPSIVAVVLSAVRDSLGDHPHRGTDPAPPDPGREVRPAALRHDDRLDPVGAGLAVGAAWSLRHLPLFFRAGTSQHELALPFGGFFCGVTVISLLMTWLHNYTGGSLWTAVFFHCIDTYFGTAVATGVTRSAGVIR